MKFLKKAFVLALIAACICSILPAMQPTAQAATLTLTASSTTLAENEIIILSCPGATSIVISRVDGAWSNTYIDSSVELAFGLAGDYTAYGTDGTNKSNCVSFTVGSSTPTTSPPTYAYISTDKTTYNIGETVTFNMNTDGDINNLWIYYHNGYYQDYRNAGSSKSLTFYTPGEYQALVETWNGVGCFTSEKITFTMIDPNATTTKPTTSSSTTTKPTTSSSTTKPTTSKKPATTKPTTSSKPTTVPSSTQPVGSSQHTHVFTDGVCMQCGAIDPNYTPPRNNTNISSSGSLFDTKAILAIIASCLLITIAILVPIILKSKDDKDDPNK